MADQATLQAVFDAALADLLPKQRLFVTEYLSCLNASEAARRAKYATKANVQGPRMLANASIRVAVNAGMALYTMPPPEVLYRLSDHARGDMSDFLTIAEEEVVIDQHVNGVLTTTETVRRQVARLDLEKAADAGALHLIKSYSKTDKGERVELYDAQAAQQLLGRHHGLFVDRTEITGKDGAPIDVTSTAMDEAAKELETWRKQMTDRLSNMPSVAPTPPTSSTDSA